MVPAWLVSMFVGLVGAALVGALGGSSLLALLVGAACGLFAHRFRHDPPLRADGRRRWRERFRRTRSSGAALARVLQVLARRSAAGPFSVPSDHRAPPPSHDPDTGDWHRPASAPRAPERGPIPVRCEFVTRSIQVWHSTETGRAYEVAAERGIADARPGDVAAITFDGGRPRVVGRVVN
jgi:hypothetical protein